MSRKRLSRNAPCPCGSGKKYKNCCYGKGFEYVESDDGSVFKSVPITDEVAQALQEQRQKFIDKHGREPGPDDQVFFDATPLERVEHEMVRAMEAAGLDPAFIYAFEKTGLLVTEQNQHLISEEDLDEWEAAIQEYVRMRTQEHFPIGTVAKCGPDDKTTTKITAGVILHRGAEPILMRWMATDVTTNPKVQQEMEEFFVQHGVKTVTMPEGNRGCPHEEGEDYPVGDDCPFCPFWRGKQGSNRQD